MKRVIVPDFKDQVCPGDRLKNPAELATYKRKRIVIAGHNVSSFYIHLYQAMERGRIHVYSPQDFRKILEGSNGTGFHPDVIKQSRHGMMFTEIKASAFRNKVKSSSNQLKRYSIALLDRLREEGEELPWVEYAFFRYGSWDSYKTYAGDAKKCREKDHRSLITRLSDETKDLTIVPLNLLIAIFSSPDFHVRENMNQATSNAFLYGGRQYQGQLNVYGGRFSDIHRKVKNVQDLISRLMERTRIDHPEWLCLDELEIQKSELGEDYSCQSSDNEDSPFYIKREITPFPIIRFRMNKDAKKKFLANYQRHFARMFEQWVRIGDLYDTDPVLPDFV